jgi:hypothetical protein
VDDGARRKHATNGSARSERTESTASGLSKKRPEAGRYRRQYSSSMISPTAKFDFTSVTSTLTRSPISASGTMMT